MVIDTGAQTNCFPKKLAENLQLQIIGTANAVKVRGAFDGAGDTIVTNDVVTLEIMTNNVLHSVNFTVVPSNNFDDVLMGWPSIQRLGLIIEEGTVFSKDRKLFGEIIPTRVNWVSVNVYKVEANQLETIMTEPGVLSLIKGSTVVETSQRPKVITDETVTNYMIPIPVDSSQSGTPSREDFKDQFIKINPNLNGKLLDKVLNMCMRYKSVFTKSSEVIGSVPCKDFTFKQEFLSSPQPFKQYKQSPAKEQFVHQEIKKLVKMGVLEPSDKYIVTAQLHCVAKKNSGNAPEEPRIVCDLRGSNLSVEASNMRLNDMNDILGDLNGKRVFINCDLTKAYWSISVDPEDMMFYTIQDPITLKVFHFCQLPMGARNASVLFQLFIQSVVLKELKVKSYIDDLFIGTYDVQEALNEFEKLLIRLDRFKLKLSLKKVSSMLNDSTVAFGYKIDETGVIPSDERIRDLLTIKIPTSKKAMLSALCRFNYFRDHILRFSAITEILYSLTHKKSTFRIEAKHLQAWNKLKSELGDAVKVKRLDPNAQLVLQSDASHSGQAGVLFQVVDGRREIIGIFSRGLTPAMKHWHINHLELWTIADALKKFDKLIGFQHITIETDSSWTYFALKTLLIKTQINVRIPALRAIGYIATYDYTIRLVKGSEESFGMTDYLSRVNEDELIFATNSRQPLYTCKVQGVKVGENDSEVSGDVIEKSLKLKSLTPLPSLNSVHELIKLSQTESNECIRIKMTNDNVNSERGYCTEGGVVYKNTPFGRSIYVPKYYTSKVLDLIHRHETAAQLLQVCRAYELWFSGMLTKIITYVSNCECNGARSCHKDKTFSKTINNPARPLDIIAIDLCYIDKKPCLMIIDHFSKYTYARLLKDETSNEIKRVLIEYFCAFGIPGRLLMDNGKNLNSDSLLNLYNCLGIIVSNSSPYGSRGNTLCERAILSLQNRLRSQHDFAPSLETQIYIELFKLNCTKQRGSALNPFQRMFGRSSAWALHNPFLRLAQNKLDSLKINKDFDLIETYQSIQKQILDERDKRRKDFVKQKFKFKTGDTVRLKNWKVENKKLFNPYSREQYKIIGLNHGVAKLREMCSIDRHPNIRLSHCRYLKKVQNLPEHIVISDRNDQITTVPEPLKSEIAHEYKSGQFTEKSEVKSPQNSRHNYSLRKRK